MLPVQESLALAEGHRRHIHHHIVDMTLDSTLDAAFHNYTLLVVGEEDTLLVEGVAGRWEAGGKIYKRMSPAYCRNSLGRTGGRWRTDNWRGTHWPGGTRRLRTTTTAATTTEGHHSILAVGSDNETLNSLSSGKIRETHGKKKQQHRKETVLKKV